MKELIKLMNSKSKDIDHNLFKALDNVNMNCILGWRDNEKHSFLDDYDK
jgi:hypothetical protein